MKTGWEALIPVLVHIQANLDGDLSLRALGKKTGLSPFHFQRVFKNAIGETPKAYTLRLRLERAAFRSLARSAANLTAPQAPTADAFDPPTRATKLARF